MNEVKTILQMIENVSPDDAAKLDEIDARVWCWLEGYEYLYSEKYGHGGDVPNTNPIQWRDNASKPYTRSRDALKEIRPEGWKWAASARTCGNFWFQMVKDGEQVGPCLLPTEELAELHATLQAIADERRI